MTPKELDEARAREADRLWGEAESRVGELSALQVAARLAREGWTPPEPVVDPDLLAFREWRVWTGHDPDDYEPLIGHAYMAGVRMAREQERERADMPIRMAKELLDRLRHLHVILSIIDTAFAEKVEAEIAKYLEASDQ